MKKPLILQRVANNMRLFLLNFLIFSCFTLFLQGCETLKNSENNELIAETAEDLHSKARKSMDAENYQKAIKLYEELEARYPFGEYAAQTQLDIAYAYYKNDDPEAAIAAADRFIKIHPRDIGIDYAYYLKGLTNFNRSIGFIERYIPTDITQRNPNNIKDSYNSFDTLLRRFPHSKYAEDAKQRMLSLRNNMAMHEVHIARFYLKRRAYVAAANRGSYVIQEYQRSPAMPYALQVMEEAYIKLDLNDLAADTKKIYEHNYPDGPPIKELQDSSFVHWLWEFFGLDQ